MSITRQYFQDNPQAKDGVMRAYFAYHTHHISDHPSAHNFTGPSRNDCCQWCGRSRESVRHDYLPPECLQRPEQPDIDAVILSEEQKAFALLKRAESDVPRLIAKHGMSGETLALLHHTHGYDPETVDAISAIPPAMLASYYERMEVERERSRTAFKPKEIKAV